MSVNASTFYKEYHGHTVKDLTALYNGLVRVNGPPSPTHHYVFLCGDSSLDNKYWILGKSVPAVNGYEQVLTPPKSVPDVAHQLNLVFSSLPSSSKHKFTCINASVEESTIGRREGGKLLEQDQFLRDHVSPHDIVLVSAGGNDIALAPTFRTVVSVGWLARCSTTSNVTDRENGSPWGIGHLTDLFRDTYTQWLNNMFSKTKPMLVVPSMIYYLDANAESSSWANTTLGLVGYNKAEGASHVQRVIDRIYYEAWMRKPLEIPGVKLVAPIELSKAMDGKDSNDYVARVEPSAAGGAKLARLYLSHITACLSMLDGTSPDAAAIAAAASGAPSSKAAAAAAAASRVSQD
jgi:hypothetical protein